MTWTKLADEYPQHPKALAAGIDGLGFDAAAMCYANKWGTDGVITSTALPAVYPPVRNPKRLAAKLVEVGRWHQAGHDCPDCPQTSDGWVIHGFLDYNPTAEEAAERAAQRAEAGRKGGQQSKPSGSKRSSGSRSKTEAAASGSASQNGSGRSSKTEAESNPVSRTPTESSSEDSGRGKRDEIFEALVEVAGLDMATLTKSERGRVNNAAKELRDVGASPDGIRARADVYRRRWPGVDLTPSALASNYSQLGTSEPKRNGRTGEGVPDWRFPGTEVADDGTKRAAW